MLSIVLYCMQWNLTRDSTFITSANGSTTAIGFVASLLSRPIVIKVH